MEQKITLTIICNTKCNLSHAVITFYTVDCCIWDYSAGVYTLFKESQTCVKEV